jgi:uncharacterized RDD family membrane protein YckC
VPLELPIAGAGTRALAAFLDYLLVVILILAWGAACLTGAFLGPRAGWWMAGLFLIGFFLVEYGYFAGVEIARQGQTFGKWAMGLRVVARDGGRAGTGALLIRNAVRTIDLLVGIPLMATDPLARRLGDRLAGTLVLHVHLPAVQVVVGRVPRGWSAQEAALLESFLRRASDLEPVRAERLARQLIDCIEHDDRELAAEIDREAPAVEALRRAVEAGAR